MKKIAAALLVMSLAGCSPPAEKQAATAETMAAVPVPTGIASRELANDFYAVQVTSDLASIEFPAVARDQCGSKAFCKVGIWTDAEMMARGFPMTDRELAAMAFQYSLNRETGFEQTLWNCETYPQSDQNSCLSTN